MAPNGMTRQTVSATGARAKAFGMGSLLTRGAAAGLVAGLVFILANMIYATTEGMPAIAPFLAIGTIFYFDDAPQMTLNYAITGVITHFSLAILFGLIFALLVPMFSNGWALTAGGFIYGGLLYLINFLVFGNLIFEWFSPGEPRGPDQIFELIIHPTTYGLVLVPFFIDVVRRLGPAPAAHAAAERAETPAPTARRWSRSFAVAREGLHPPVPTSARR